MDIDINTRRVGATVACFLIFIGIMAWTFAGRNRQRFEHDALIPFDHDQ
jgi:cytochrome c oxidase cbb3-type subunit IV